MKHYTIKKKTYYPNDTKVDYLEILFEDAALEVLGKLLTLYGRNKLYYDDTVKHVLMLRKINKDIALLKEKYWVIDDNGVDEDTGYNLGLIAIIANPEYYPHIYYQLESCLIFLLQENNKPVSFEVEQFVEIIKWWQGYLDRFRDENDDFV